ncbi:MAG TPA: ABC transporter permease [Acidimicrobiales bacterium]|nr:ABC transporter permease [Acidimicrobiales bacterium]
MLSITLHDLWFRARQFLIAVVGAGLVFAMTLLLTGLAAGFGIEVTQTVRGMGSQAWVVAQGSSGRVAALSPIPAFAEFSVIGSLGVRRASPVIIVPQAATVGHQLRSVVLIGYSPGGLGVPPVVTGRPVSSDGEAVVDSSLDLAPGQRLSVSGHTLTVVGTVNGRTLLGGIADAYVSLGEAQAIVFGGRPLVSAILTTGVPHTLPAGLIRMSNAQVESRSLAAMSSASSSIDNSRLFMWVIAAVIVAALVYVTALQRTRDFAVLKALGASSRALFFSLATQAVLVSFAAAALGAAMANFMSGIFSQPVDIPSSAFIVLPISALVVGLLASLVALRRAVSVDPATAFAGA